ncbi:MAG: Regulator of nonsense transcripts upf2, partial [Paramarteilia canceri]
MSKRGEVSDSTKNLFEDQFSFVNNLKESCIEFRKLTHITMEGFNNDLDLVDSSQINLTEEDYIKMFNNEQEYHFYCKFVDCNQSNLNIPENTDPNYKLTSSFSNFLLKLMKCYNMDQLDNLVIEYITKYNTKQNLKSLISSLCSFSGIQSEVLPFYARFIGSLSNKLSGLSNSVIEAIMSSFRTNVMSSNSKNQSFKLKIIRYI